MGGVLDHRRAFGGNEVQVSLGIVFGDDFYSRIEGFATQESQFELVRTTVRDSTINDRQVLGRRRRRYQYETPPGWSPIVRNLTTDWISPGFPARWGVIVAYAATPVEPGVEVDAGEIAGRAVERGFAIDGTAHQTEVKSDRGFSGMLTEMTGQQSNAAMFRAFVALTDDNYLYPCELMSRTADTWPEHREAFTALWRSIEPIPMAPTASGAFAFDFWAG